jgi:hypothetical protein
VNSTYLDYATKTLRKLLFLPLILFTLVSHFWPISHVPAPQYFSSQRKATEAVQLIHQSRYQEGQNITFYGQVQEDF